MIDIEMHIEHQGVYVFIHLLNKASRRRHAKIRCEKHTFDNTKK